MVKRDKEDATVEHAIYAMKMYTLSRSEYLTYQNSFAVEFLRCRRDYNAQSAITDHNSAHNTVITMTKCGKMEFPTKWV